MRAWPVFPLLALLLVVGLPPVSAEVQEVEVLLRDNQILPAEVYLKPGIPARLTFINQDKQAHGFGLYELGIIGRIEPGTRKTFSIPTSTPGRYPFMCAIYCGSNHYNMKGTIVISDSAEPTPALKDPGNSSRSLEPALWGLGTAIGILSLASLAGLILLRRLKDGS